MRLYALPSYAFPSHSSHYSPSFSSSSSLCKVHFSLSFLTATNLTGSKARWVRMDSTNPSISASRHNRRKEKLLVIMGATGTGKSRLSVDLATRFLSFEIINSDKMQVYKGLDITTNKIGLHERAGVPHHLLGDIDPTHRGELSPLEFRSVAGETISDIVSRRKLPVLVGGSNSFIHALVVDRFDPNSDVFDGSVSVSVSSSELRYNCCFLWVDVSMKVLSDYLSDRVDDMLDSGMFEELAEFYDPEEDHSDAGRTGLRKAIGVPEFDRYFEKYYGREVEGERDRMRREAYEEAVRSIKENTHQLAKRQVGKILRLREGGWDLQRVDATEAFRAVLTSSGRWSEIWEKQVMEPSVKIVKRFLEE
ncbi:adenylate isopentenyltransferase isoform X2 [Ziziphus jujuba]|uniref:Adenylate isopentenyltransferase isoform X2 n=2 Tax=Ziziphus jujuba TaxID=326968 RepID=A0ABM3I1W2_ZIZJJ|nr:adenylate isopentenyltransferase isoform X2 [Ziziphus jujuba]KAH7516521.1 hypothetical protein FEM48_Zijuj10G0143900 [Ziziphus jujuba var. spinosa]